MSEEKIREILRELELQLICSKSNKKSEHYLVCMDSLDAAKLLSYTKKVTQENKRLNKELEIYKLRHKEVLKKLNSTIEHYNLGDKNNAIKFCKEILEGKSIVDRVHKKIYASSDYEIIYFEESENDKER